MVQHLFLSAVLTTTETRSEIWVELKVRTPRHFRRLLKILSCFFFQMSVSILELSKGWHFCFMATCKVLKCVFILHWKENKTSKHCFLRRNRWLQQFMIFICMSLWMLLILTHALSLFPLLLPPTRNYYFSIWTDIFLWGISVLLK